MQNNNEVFILGAGFSNAISDSSLPTLERLNEIINDDYIDGEKSITNFHFNYDLFKKMKHYYKEYINDNGINNIEEALTFIYEDIPWKEEPERLLLKSIYDYLSELIALIIENKKNESDYKRRKETIETIDNLEKLEKEIGSELSSFIHYIHENKSKLITFNYDNLLETIALYLINCPNNKVDTEDFYRMPLMRIHARVFPKKKVKFKDTFRLIKLHGSLNWFYSKESKGQIYLSSGYLQKLEKVLKRDLSCLIIPLLFGKSTFMNLGIIKRLWLDARNYLGKANKIYILGYSLPESDLVVRLLLKINIKEKTEIIIVYKKREVFDNFKDLFMKKNMIIKNTSYINSEKNVIFNFFKDKCINNKEI